MVVTGNIRGPWILEAALHHGPKKHLHFYSAVLLGFSPLISRLFIFHQNRHHHLLNFPS